MDLLGKTAIFLGDSITEGAGTSSEENRYYNILKSRYGLKEVIGYGVGGTRIAKQIVPSKEERYDLYFSKRADDMQEYADIVVVFGGTNDYGHGDAPLGKFGDKTPDTFYGACYELFNKLIEKYIGSIIVVATPLHRVNEMNLRGEGTKENDVAVLSAYVDIIKEVARYFSLPVCDLYSISGLQPNVPLVKEKYIPDGLHPNDAGNAIIAERLGEFLKGI